MAYDEGLAQRAREVVDAIEALTPGEVSEKKMFGGLCFLLRGNMCCGLVGDELMVRLGADAYAEALTRPHAREMDFTGRALKGMVYVAPPGLEADDDLAGWIGLGVAFAGSLPPK